LGIVVGVDVAQKHDPTVVAVAEHEGRKSEGREENHRLVRDRERLPLETPYPQVADCLAEVASGGGKRAQSTLTVYMNATGVGQPVVNETVARGLWMVTVYSTHGNSRTEEGFSTVSLSKVWLVSRMQTFLQGGRIHLPDTQETHTLARELLDYEIRVSEHANDRYGAFKVGTHDGLVTALGLAVQRAPW